VILEVAKRKRLSRQEFYNYSILRLAFEYDPSTGVITHKLRGPEVFEYYGIPDPEVAADNSRRWAGKRALNTWVESRKCLTGELAGRRVSAARVAFSLGYKGEFLIPSHIGYRDGDPRNLRLANLIDRYNPNKRFTPAVDVPNNLD